MDLRPIKEGGRAEYDSKVTHVLQSFGWGEFRKSMGVKVGRYGLFEDDKLKKAFQITFHQIPFVDYSIGYLPKGSEPDKDMVSALQKIGRENRCAFIKVEPNVESSEFQNPDPMFKKSPYPLFTKYNFVLDLTKTEEEILRQMHPKTRYNIRVAKRYEVSVEERTDDEAFEIYLRLYFETTGRQRYHGHNVEYHRKVWEAMKKDGKARLLIASYMPPGSPTKVPLVAWMLFVFRDTLYYPYGGSSLQYKETMANNLVAWEAIRLGRKLGLKYFDMWGALAPNASPKHPWFGFHKFKLGYGGRHIEYLGSFDLVFNWPLYTAFNIVSKFTALKLAILKFFGK